jgi:hypothetical protein
VYYDFGAEPTRASNEVIGQTLTLKEPSAQFVCFDTSGGDNAHPTGGVKKWTGEVPLKREQRLNAGGQKVLQLQSHPQYELRYTTDGSNPKESGGVYSGDIVLPAGCRYVRTAAYYKGELVGAEDIEIADKPGGGKEEIEINDATPLEYTLNMLRKCTDTEQAYNEFAKLAQLPGTFVRNFTVTVSEKENPDNYMEITAAKVEWDTDNLRTIVDRARETAFANKDVEVEFAYKTVLFTTGAAFKQWIDQNKIDAGELTAKGAIKQ